MTKPKVKNAASTRHILATRLLLTRRKAGLTQEEVAEAAGISVSYLSMLERNARSASLDVVDALAVALKVKAPFLLGA